MTELMWDATGEKVFETGVDHGVLYTPNSEGVYDMGVAWNGLVNVNETPSGAEENPQYADNIKYLSLRSAEEFGATLEAFTYPKEFAQHDGLAIVSQGITIGGQSRKPFGLSYRTLVGDDINGMDAGYKIHLVYGCSANPSEKAYSTVNDSPEAVTFSWELTTVPVAVPGYKPTASLVVDSREVDPTDLGTLLQILYGTPGDDPRLPLPAEVMTIFGSGVNEVTPSAISQVGNVVTLTETAGVIWRANGSLVTLDGDGSTDVTITEDTLFTAHPASGYVFPGTAQTEWFAQFT